MSELHGKIHDAYVGPVQVEEAAWKTPTHDYRLRRDFRVEVSVTGPHDVDSQSCRTLGDSVRVTQIVTRRGSKTWVDYHQAAERGPAREPG